MARQIDPRFEAGLFRHQTHFNVRFADLDALAHVNHATYLVYMEQARMDYAREVWGWDGEMHTLGMILAKVEVEYLLPLFLGDVVTVWTRIPRLGNKSFDFLYRLERADPTGNQLVATGQTAMVAYDYTVGQTMSFVDDRRARTLSFEPSLNQD
jgi:acyl-CoA thioester hydrolase